MTERPEEVALAAQAQAQGEAAAGAHDAWAESMQASVAGSEVRVEQPATPDDVSTPWIGTPSEPPAVSPQPSYSPNLSEPLDNSQSQG